MTELNKKIKTLAQGSNDGNKYAIKQETATVDEIFAEGNKIFAKINTKSDRTNNECDILINKLRQEHTDFATTFPVIFQWMVHTGEYNPKVFKQYLLILSHDQEAWQKNVEMLKSQAKYLTMLYHSKHPHCDEKKLNKFREEITKQLLDEDEAMKEAYKKLPEELKKYNSNIDTNRRERIFDYLTYSR